MVDDEVVDGFLSGDVDGVDDEPELESLDEDFASEEVVEDVSFLVDDEPLSLLSASRADPNVPAERLSVL